MKYADKIVRSFTSYGLGYLDELRNEVYVSEAFDTLNPPTPIPQFRQYVALWDTGATNTGITPQLAKELNLQPTGQAEVHAVHSSHVVNTYLVNIALPNKVIIPSIRVTGTDLGGGIDVLIGMDIIRHGDFAVSNSNNRTIFSFRTPPIEEIDFQKEIKEEHQLMKKRNTAQASTKLAKSERNKRKSSRRKNKRK